jgi:hypothetical protein
VKHNIDFDRKVLENFRKIAESLKALNF